MFPQNLLVYLYQDLYLHRLIPYTNTLLHQALLALENMHLKLSGQHNRICPLIANRNVQKAYQYIASHKINADFSTMWSTRFLRLIFVKRKFVAHYSQILRLVKKKNNFANLQNLFY